MGLEFRRYLKGGTSSGHMRWINFITASSISTGYFLTLQQLPTSFALLVV